MYLNSPTYILNVTDLHIKSYSVVKNSPDKARIIGLPPGSDPNLSLSPTMYHILGKSIDNSLVDPSADATSALLPNLGLSDEELQKFMNSEAIIRLFNTELTIENVQVNFDSTSQSLDFAFLNPFSNFGKQVVVKDIEFHFRGDVIHTETPLLNLTMQNLKIDTQNLHQIMSLSTRCVEGSPNTGKIHLENINITYFGSKSPDILGTNSILDLTLSQDLHMENVSFNLDASHILESPQVWIKSQGSGCSVSEPLVYNLTDITFFPPIFCQI